jgi:transposase
LVASGVETRRRRRYSIEEKQAVLHAVSEPGATVSEVSRHYGVTRSLIHNWRRQEAVGMLGATVRFAAVDVAPGHPSAPVVVGAAPRAACGMMEIELSDGARVRVDGDVNEAALKRVLRVLRGR